MRKADLISIIADKTGIPKVNVMSIVETMCTQLKASIVEGDPVFIRGFGSFIAKKRARKVGRNIKRNIEVIVPEHMIPFFKPSKEFLLEVKNSTLPKRKIPKKKV